jgi:hypothetical protein
LLCHFWSDVRNINCSGFCEISFFQRYKEHCYIVTNKKSPTFYSFLYTYKLFTIIQKLVRLLCKKQIDRLFMEKLHLYKEIGVKVSDGTWNKNGMLETAKEAVWAIIHSLVWVRDIYRIYIWLINYIEINSWTNNFLNAWLEYLINKHVIIIRVSERKYNLLPWKIIKRH